MRVRKVTPIVKEQLEKNIATRNSDALLYLEVLRVICAGRSIDIESMTVPTLLSNVSALHLPTCESVGRARRKLQSEYPELRASEDVEAFRDLLEEDYRRYSREVCHG